MRRLRLPIYVSKPRYKCRHLLLCLWDNGKSLCICFMQTFIRKYYLRIPSKFKSFHLIFQPHCITIFPRQRRRILEIQYGKSFISKNATSSSGDNCTRDETFDIIASIASFLMAFEITVQFHAVLNPYFASKMR